MGISDSSNIPGGRLKITKMISHCFASTEGEESVRLQFARIISKRIFGSRLVGVHGAGGKHEY